LDEFDVSLAPGEPAALLSVRALQHNGLIAVDGRSVTIPDEKALAVYAET
jgi:hypothetical protein